LAESHKLDPRPSDEGPTPKSDESKLNLQGTILEGKSSGFDPQKKKQRAQSKAYDLEKQHARGMVQLKDSICFKRVQIGS
jgi:hypothetical protein